MDLIQQKIRLTDVENTSVVYNVLGKPATINLTDGRKIEYTYDAAGNKITMKNYQGATLLNTTDYVAGFVYSNNALSFFGSPEGRVVKKGSVYEYEYAIADHQALPAITLVKAG